MTDILNWYWQGGVLALATAAALGVMSRLRARDRYVLCWIATLGVLMLPILPRVRVATSSGGIGFPADVSVVTISDGWWASGVLVAIWMFAWSMTQIVRTAAAMAAVRCARQTSRPLPSQIASDLPCWNAVRRRGRPCDLRVSDAVQSAGLLGCGRPMIVVSPGLAEHLEADELDRIVIHEWAHVQRRDDWTSLAQLAVHAVAGWHPAVWWLSRHIVIERESACDEAAVAVTGCARRYGESLTSVAELCHTAMPVPALRMPGALSSPHLRARILRILTQGHLMAPGWSLVAAIPAAVSLCLLSTAMAGSEIIRRDTFEAGATHTQSAPPIHANGRQAPTLEPVSNARPESTGVWRSVAAGGSPRPESGRLRTAPPGPVSKMPGHGTVSAGSGPTAVPAHVLAFEPIPDLEARPALGVTPPHVTSPAQRAIPTGAAPRPSAPSARRLSAPWAVAADAGGAVGRASKNTASATAGVFTRFGRKVAASF